MGYGKWLSPVFCWGFLFYFLSHVSTTAVLLCSFLRVRHRAVAELRDDGYRTTWPPSEGQTGDIKAMSWLEASVPAALPGCSVREGS